MAHGASGPAREDGGQLGRSVRRHGMAREVHAAVEPVQAAGPEPPRDRGMVEAGRA